VRSLPQIETAIAEMEKATDCYFFPSGAVGDQILNQRYPGFWGGALPATRTNTHQYLTQFYFLNMIRRPQKAIKVYRKRGQFAVSDVNDLNYDNAIQRAQKFVSLNVGEKSLNETDTSYQYMDNLSNTSLYTSPSRLNEYTLLAGGNTVSIADYALIEIVLDKIKLESLKISLKGSDDGRSIFLKNNKSSATWEDPSRSATAFNVSKEVYDSINITPGDTYSNTSVKVGTEVDTMTFAGKVYDYRLGYLLCFNHSSTATVSNQTSGQLIKISGSGDSSIDTIKHDANLRYSFEFFSQLGQAEGAFEEVDFTFATTAHEHTFTKADLMKYMSYDKIVLLVSNDVSFSLGNISCEYTGGQEKEVFDKLHLPKAGISLIEQKTFDASGSGWTIDAGGSIKQIPSNYEDYPDIAGGTTAHHVEIGFDTEDAPIKLRKSITSPAEITGFRKLTVKVVNRLFPKIYTPSGSETDYTTTARQITPETYDDGVLCVAIKPSTGGESVSRQPIGIGWNMATFELLIPASLGDFELQIYRDPADIVQKGTYFNHTYPLQIVYVDAKIEQTGQIGEIPNSNNIFYNAFALARSLGYTVEEDVFNEAAASDLPLAYRMESDVILAPGIYKSGSIAAIDKKNGKIIDLANARAGQASYFDKDGLLKMAPANMPRLDYSRGAAWYLFEKGATNLVKYSNDLSQSPWSFAGVTVASNADTALDGTQTASVLTVSGSGSNNFTAYILGNLGAGNFTASFYVKMGTKKSGYIYRIYDNTTHTAIVNFTDYTSQLVEGKFVRIQIPFTVLAGQDNVSLLITSETAPVAGTFIVDGVQVENGSFATSLIQTNGAIGVRPADSSSLTSSLATGDTGSLFMIFYTNVGLTGLMKDTSNRQMITNGDGAFGLQASGVYSSTVTGPKAISLWGGSDAKVVASGGKSPSIPYASGDFSGTALLLFGNDTKMLRVMALFSRKFTDSEAALLTQ